jgi:hypothetical protein
MADMGTTLCGLVTWTNKIAAIFLHLNSLRPIIKFTMEVEVNDILPFLDNFIMK